MQMNHILTAGSLMKIINVLGDHSQLGHMHGKLCDATMCPVWLCLDAPVPTPLVFVSQQPHETESN